MKSIGVSTATISGSARFSILRAQERLLNAQTEVSSGRHADIGLKLGHNISETVSLRSEVLQMEQVMDTNNTVNTRLEMTQASLNNIVEGAQEFIDSLLASRSSPTGPEFIKQLGEARLSSLVDVLNSNVDGTHIFSGVNSNVKALESYETAPPSAAKTAIDAAFLAEFGFDQTNAAVSGITPAQLDTFLTGAYATEFDPAAWTANWSNAADEPISNRISLSETIDTSISANEEAFRQLANAFTAAIDLGSEGMNTTTFQSLVDTLVSQTSEAIQKVSVLQAQVGIVEQRVSDANERLDLQVDVFQLRISEMEDVDAYEASTRLTTILNEIEISYSLTARIQRLSILNYL